MSLYSLIFFLILQFLSSFSVANSSENDYVAGRLLVKLKENYPMSKFNLSLKKYGLKQFKSYSLVKGLKVYKFDKNRDVKKVKEIINKHDAVIYAEPDYIHKIDAEVNDPRFNDQWALKNPHNDSDINAEAMWDLSTGSKNIAIGVIDTGIDYNHSDLSKNIWNNKNEIPNNNKDDDKNGFIDDIHGINSINDSGDPMDDHKHGTHVSGIIGARGNNSIGISGVAHNVTIIGCKFLNSIGRGSTSDAIKCMEYIAELKTRKENPVNIIATNNSWGGGTHSNALRDAIKAHKDLSILFIAAAGNDTQNNDRIPHYPSNYDVDNIISVAATDKTDELALFSNYGKKSVHIAAPGVGILSTVLDNKYAILRGTSMAAPYVTGLAVLLKDYNEKLSYKGIKNLIITGGTPIEAAKNKTISGRRLMGASKSGLGSLTCSDQRLVIRKAPKKNNVTIHVGEELFLKAKHLNCNEKAQDLVVFESDDLIIKLTDTGEDGDKVKDDGIYSTIFIPKKEMSIPLHFGKNDTVTLRVVKNNEQ